MDEEVLNAIKSQLLEVKEIVEGAIDDLEVDVMESSSTGKSIAIDFDDTDLTGIQISVDDASSRLQELSAEISTYLE